MSDISLAVAAALCAAAFLAGWIDAVVGGGGLVQLPALLIGLPAHLPPTYALGTNKVVSLCGTAVSAVTYARRAPLDVRAALRLGALALASAAGGALFASAVDRDVLQPVIMVVLLAVAAFVVARPRFGSGEGRPPTRRGAVAGTLVAGIGIGFYDGLIGPGTGTFLVIALVTLLRMSLLTASATAKVVNVGTNVGGLLVFAADGAVLWALVPFMAAFNMAGGWTGAHMAMRRGNGFVRVVLLVVVTALVARLAYDQWWA